MQGSVSVQLTWVAEAFIANVTGKISLVTVAHQVKLKILPLHKSLVTWSTQPGLHPVLFFHVLDKSPRCCEHLRAMLHSCIARESKSLRSTVIHLMLAPHVFCKSASAGKSALTASNSTLETGFRLRQLGCPSCVLAAVMRHHLCP